MARAPKESVPVNPAEAACPFSLSLTIRSVTSTVFCWLRASRRPTQTQREKEEALPLHGGVSRSRCGPAETGRAIFGKAIHPTACTHGRLCLERPLSNLTTDSYPSRGFRPKPHFVREPALTGPPRLYPASGLDAPSVPSASRVPPICLSVSSPDCELCEDRDFASPVSARVCFQ